MICKIADLITDIPVAGDMVPRCWNYLYHGGEKIKILIKEEKYRSDLYSASFTAADVAYMESARQFYYYLLSYEGLHLHSSAVTVDGKAYLFSADPGVGKSTHARLWQSIHGHKAEVINDDKPALRCINGRWYAYGTPWCGKDGINLNRKAPIAGICFLKQGEKNEIRQLNQMEALAKVLPQTFYRLKSVEKMDLLLNLVENLIQTIPVFELINKPEREAAELSYETMSQKAKELGL